MKVFSFVAAASNSGKTTLIEKVVRLIKARGLRVAVIKHASEGFDLNEPDLDEYLRSGAESVIVVGQQKVTMIRKVEDLPSIEEMKKDVGEVDITLYEGFKENASNKIEVFRYGVSGNRPLCMDDPTFIAIAADRRFSVSVPQFDINDAEGIADFLMEKYQHGS